MTLATDTWTFRATLPVSIRGGHRQLDFDGAVTWTARQHGADPTIEGTLRLDLDSDPLLATAAVMKAKVDSFVDDVSPGVVSKVRASLRDVPFVGSFVGGVEHVMGVAVTVTAAGVERTLRGSLRFLRRPQPADEPVAVSLTLF